MDDAELGASVQRWAEAVEMAPAYVKPLLDEAHRSHRQLSARYECQAATATVRGRNLERMDWW
jgi:hypothetical protein